MNPGEMQAELRHFAAQRDWQPFHAPKNLATALVVEAAELAEIFQWITPRASAAAHEDAESKARVGAGVADVRPFRLQVADHCQIDLAHAVRAKPARSASKYPAKRTIPRVSPPRASVPGTHVLLEGENMQPTPEQARALVPDARQPWVFHGPHQRDVEQRLASFGSDVAAVPISKTGKNALDFHFSFCMGCIASKNPVSAMVVIANDQGCEPMLEPARPMGFAVRRVAHGDAKPAAKKAAARNVAAVPSVPGQAATIKRLADNLGKTGDKRSTKLAPLPKGQVVVVALMRGLGGSGRPPLRGIGLSRCASSRRGAGVSTPTGLHP